MVGAASAVSRAASAVPAKSKSEGARKGYPIVRGEGGGNFVDLQIVLSPCIRPSASVDFEARLFDIVCLVVWRGFDGFFGDLFIIINFI